MIIFIGIIITQPRLISLTLGKSYFSFKKTFDELDLIENQLNKDLTHEPLLEPLPLHGVLAPLGLFDLASAKRFLLGMATPEIFQCK